MGITHRWASIAGAVLISGALLGSAAFAAGTGGGTGDGKPNPAPGASPSQMTPAEADLLRQIGELRKSHMEQLKRDIKNLMDQAVKDGKITQAQADRLTQRVWHHKHHKGLGKPMTREQLQSMLAEAVKSGKMTQDQADRILKRWEERQAQKESKQSQSSR